MTDLPRAVPRSGSIFPIKYCSSFHKLGNMSWSHLWFHESPRPRLLAATSPLALKNEPSMGLPFIKGTFFTKSGA